MSDEGEATRGLGLDEVLASLRHDLVAARDHRGDGYGLGVREVEIELSVEISRTRTGEASAGAKWFVLSGDASGRASSDRTSAHRIKLTLGPIVASGSAVAGGEPLQDAGEEPGEPSASAGDVGARIADVP